MKTIMYAFIGAVTGGLSALGVWQYTQTVAHHQSEQDHLQQLMYAQVSPIKQGPGNATTSVPPGVLPLDATPFPGVPEEKGSTRPTIQLKPGHVLTPPAANTNAILVLKKTDKTVKETKDPIWELQLVLNKDKVLESIPALTGRANKQSANRHISGNKSPLPQGTYRIDRNEIAIAPFSDPELGKGFWIPITPLFSTGRSALGFHQDPSWGKLNGESGTSGCIGLESADATSKVVSWIKHYNIRTLVVAS